MQKIIEIKNLVKKYRIGSEIITALDSVSFELQKGEFVAILGTSGSGKSTFLNLMSGLERPTKGEIYIGGKLLNKVKEGDMADFRRYYMGFIFQSYNLIPALTAIENATLPLIFQEQSKKERMKRGKDLLTELGIGDRLFNKPSQLSGGQQQRVSIARALIGNPKLIFADEPTGNLDAKTTTDILGIMTRIVKEKEVSLVMVTHDREVAGYADRILHMIDGKIVREETK